jgi:hypothetical protein
MTIRLALAVTVALFAQSPVTSPSSSAVPQPQGTTPGACGKEVRDTAAKRRADLMAVPTAGMTADALNQRNQLSRSIETDRLTMAKACAAKFDPKTTADSMLADLATLYNDAQMTDLSKETAARALALKTLMESERATLLVLTVTNVLKEPKSDERNARLETYVADIDRLSDSVIEQKFAAHQAANNYYRYDDLDAGIIKHSGWMVEALHKFTPDQRKRFGQSVVNAFVNLAEAWAGQGMNDKPVALLEHARSECADVPNLGGVDSELERLKLVGTAGAPLTAPRWLNLAGKTTLDLKGKVTLLEFSAHWCVPCKESYPGVNRLRAKYGPRGFQAVLATELYGYFQTERDLDAATEFARD